MRSIVTGFLFCILSLALQAQNNYRTRASGDWNNPTVWQVENPVNVWTVATSAPDFNVNNIQVRSGHTITITANITLDQLVVRDGGRLFINDGVEVTLNNGTGNDFSMGASAETHFLGEGHIAGSGNAILNGNLYLYSLNPTGAITAGTGATGNIRVATRSYYATTTIHYVGSGAQVWGSAHPAVAATRINNSNGVSITGFTETNGPLSVNNGTLTVGASNLKSTSTITVNGGILQFQNAAAGSRTFNLLNITVNAGSVAMTSPNGANSATVLISSYLNLSGGGMSMTSSSGNLFLEINGDVLGTNKVTGSGDKNYFYLNGTGALTNSFPIASGATIRTLRINRPGLSLTVPYSFDLSWLFVLSGSVTLNTDFTIGRDLNLATGTSLNFTGFDLTLNGPVNNSYSGGTVTSGTSSTLSVVGTTGAASNIIFTDGSQLQSLVIDRPGAVTIDGNISISSSLALTRGSLSNLGEVTMGEGSSVTRNSACSVSGAALLGGPYSLSYSGTSVTTGLEAQGSISNLTSGLSGTLSINLPLSLSGNLTVNSGTVNTGANAISAVDFVNSGTFNAPTSSLSVSGDFTNNGPFNTNGGTVVFNGSSTQNLGGSSLINFNNLTLAASASVSVQSNQNLRGVLTLNNNATLDADGSSDNAVLTILSVDDAAGSDGSIAALGTGASVTGNVSVQRYWGIEDNDFRYISSPVSNGTVQQLLDAGIFITGYPGTDYPCGGLCDNDNGNLSYYVETLTGTFQNGWTDFPGQAGSASDTFVPGRGYGLYVWNGTQPTLWTSRGTINQGTISYTISRTASSPADPNADGWNLVGNPYPSSIVWEDNAELPGGWTFGANISPTVWIYDEVAEQWMFYNRNTNTGNFDGVIATGQAFWVQVTSVTPSATLQIHEAAKTGSSGAYYRKAPTTQNMLTVSLRRGEYADKAFAIEQAGEHTAKFGTGRERMSVSFVDNQSKLAIFSSEESIETMPLHVQVRESGDYQLVLASNGLEGYYLIDKLTGEYVAADKSMTFHVATEGAEFADRFVVTRNVPSVEQQKEAVLISTFPNPVSAGLTVKTEGEVLGVSVTNGMGQVVRSAAEVSLVDGVSSVDFDLSDLNKGVYIIRVVMSDRSVHLRKIVKL
jgi:hypothetical protein